MATVHLFLQGKGGVGKSFCFAMYAQYRLDGGGSLEGGTQPICIDTDPVNATISSYPAFQAHRIDILDQDRIDPLKFDQIIERIAGARSEDIILVDNGASSFIAFSEFLITNGVPQLLADMGHALYIHTVVTGGDAQGDTVHGFAALAKNFQDPARIIVWLNPYYGRIEREGKRFEDFKAFKDNAARVSGLIHIPDFKKDTFGVNLSQILKARQTFTEALAMPEYPLMTRQRIKMMRDQIYAQIATCPEL